MFTMQSDFGFAKGDWVRVVLIAFRDSVTIHFSFQKDAKDSSSLICFKIILLYCVEKLSLKDFRHLLANR